MKRDETRDDETLEKTEAEYEEVAPPAALDDVEDAVTPFVGGELTDWSPPEHAQDAAADEAPARDR